MCDKELLMSYPVDQLLRMIAGGLVKEDKAGNKRGAILLTILPREIAGRDVQSQFCQYVPPTDLWVYTCVGCLKRICLSNTGLKFAPELAHTEHTCQYMYRHRISQRGDG